MSKKKKHKKDKKQKSKSQEIYFPVCLAAYVTLSVNGYIGDKGERPPWNLQTDRQRFKEVTSGKLVIMGRKAWESFPHHKNHDAAEIIVLSKDFVNHTPYPCTHLQSVSDVMNYIAVYMQDIASVLIPILYMGKNKNGEYLHSCINSHGQFEVIIAGGKEVYDQFLFGTSKIYTTWVRDDEYKGDTQLDEHFFGRDKSENAELQLVEDECFAVDKDKNHSHDMQCTTTIVVTSKGETFNDSL